MWKCREGRRRIYGGILDPSLHWKKGKSNYSQQTTKKNF
jgi:hypothetical protein